MSAPTWERDIADVVKSMENLQGDALQLLRAESALSEMRFYLQGETATSADLLRVIDRYFAEKSKKR